MLSFEVMLHDDDRHERKNKNRKNQTNETCRVSFCHRIYIIITVQFGPRQATINNMQWFSIFLRLILKGSLLLLFGTLLLGRDEHNVRCYYRRNKINAGDGIKRILNEMQNFAIKLLVNPVYSRQFSHFVFLLELRDQICYNVYFEWNIQNIKILKLKWVFMQEYSLSFDFSQI